MTPKEREEIEEVIKSVENSKKCMMHFIDVQQEEINRLREKLNKVSNGTKKV